MRTQVKQAITTSYETATIFEAHSPIIRFNEKASEVIRQASLLRKKDWQTTQRWNYAADQSGLTGEIAVPRYLGIPAQQIVEDFVNGLQGDRGYDLKWCDELIDVKSTIGRGLKFKFSKTNRHRDKATIYVFVRVEEVGLETWATILGWSRRQEITPYLKDDGRSYFVRSEALRRRGLLYPINQLRGTQID